MKVMKLCTAQCSSSLATHYNDPGVLFITLVPRMDPRNRPRLQCLMAPRIQCTCPCNHARPTERGTPAQNQLPQPDPLLQPPEDSCRVGGGRKEGPRPSLPSASRRPLILHTLILSLLAKFFEGKKANKKTHNSKGTQLIFFHPLKRDRKRKTT